MRLKKARLLPILLIMTLVASLFGGMSASAATTETISKLVLSKNEVALEVGSTASLTATAIYESGTTETATIKADWSSSDTTVATAYAGVITAKGKGTAVVTATYMGQTVIVNVTVSKKVRSLIKDKQSLDLRKDDSEQITVTAYYDDGTSEDVTAKSTWNIDNGSVATVFDGKVTGLASGSANVTATYNNQTVTVPVNVEIAKRVDASQTEISLLLNDPVDVTLEATYPDGTKQDVTAKAEWESEDPSIADVLNGKITGYSAGKTTIYGTYGTKTAAIAVEVDNAIKLELNKQSLLIKKGNTEQLVLNASYASGDPEDITARATWTSSNNDIVSVVKGKLIANAIGEATVTAQYGDKTVTVKVDVDVPRRLDASSDVLYMQTAQSSQITLTATYADNSEADVTADAEWSVNNTDIAFVNKGKVTAYKAGEALVTAKYGDKTVTIKISVDVPSTLSVNKKTVNLQVGGYEQAVLKALYTDGSEVDVSSKAEWTSSDSAVVDVRNGLISGVDTGTATVTAKYGTRTTTIKVSVGLLKSLTTTSDLTLALSKGDTKTISLTAVYMDGTSKDVVADAEWTSSNATAVTVDAGVITALESGEATITAAFGGKTVTLAVKVDMANKLKASTALVSFDLGDTKSITLTATDANDNAIDVTKEAEWISSNESMVLVSSEGVLTPVARGKATITAKYGGKSVTISVEIGVVQTLEVSKKYISAKTGDTVQLTLSATLSDGTKRDVTTDAVWKSNAYKVADVSNGLVTAVSAGSTNISATFGGKTVTVPIAVDTLKYLKTDLILVQMKAGSTTQVTALATFEDQSEADVTVDGLWTTSSLKVADVKDGTIRAIGKGKATITVTYAKKKTYVYVTVTE
ncbi:Ig-like domain-containing protein [Paenibacillus sp. y28]|uniref:Ig-like domain-containing protein n=1 Tax=Paenibacillus sp. y28 TaxID=3129110 RepID=UPI003015BF65